jgi:hypothetical protein
MMRSPANRSLNSFWWQHDDALRKVGLVIMILGAVRPFFG